MRIRAAVALSVATLFWTLPAAAVSYTVMFERDDNVGAGEELVFRSYATYDDLLTNTSPSDVFSPIDLAANFSSTGLLSVPPPNGGGSGPAIPEPGALVLFAAGLATVCRPAWRRRSG